MDKDGLVYMKECGRLRAEVERLNVQLKKRDKCAYIGPMRDCKTHGESLEMISLKEELVAANGRVEKCRGALEAIREAVRGGYVGRWDTFDRVYAIRGGIADACDIALSYLPEADKEKS